MSKIYVEKLNEVWMRVESDDVTEVELYNKFSFFVDGYKYMPKFKAGVWDGQIHLWNQNTKRMYFGLYTELKQFAKENSHAILDSVKNKDPEFSVEYISTWLDSQILTSGDDIIECRDYQYTSVVECLHNKRKVIKSPTSSGKTLILYLISKFLYEHGKRILIQTDSTNLVSQTYTDWIDYSQANKFQVEDITQKIYGGLDKNITKPIAISTWQTQHSQNKNKEFGYFNEFFDAVLIDEAHRSDTNSITGILENCTDIEYRMGFSGSIKKTKMNQMQLTGLLGPVHKAITTRELIDRGEVADVKINMVICKYPKIVHKVLKDKKYQDQIEWLLNVVERNRFIVNLAASKKGNSLILFNNEFHGELLVDLCKELYPNIPVFFINGKTKTETREEIRSKIEGLEKSITVGSFGTISTGWSVKNLHNLILAHPYKSPIRIIQSIGRVLRLFKNKFKCNMYDICDILVTSGKRDYLKKHTAQRAEIYIDEELNFSTHEIEFDIGIEI
jgi:superfamily II DNA or RNA helicase